MLAAAPRPDAVGPGGRRLRREGQVDALRRRGEGRMEGLAQAEAERPPAGAGGREHQGNLRLGPLDQERRPAAVGLDPDAAQAQEVDGEGEEDRPVEDQGRRRQGRCHHRHHHQDGGEGEEPEDPGGRHPYFGTSTSPAARSRIRRALQPSSSASAVRIRRWRQQGARKRLRSSGTR